LQPKAAVSEKTAAFQVVKEVFSDFFDNLK